MGEKAAADTAYNPKDANLPALSSERAGVAELADAHGSGPCSLR